MTIDFNNRRGSSGFGSAIPFFLALLVIVLVIAGGYAWWQVRPWEINETDIDAGSAAGPLRPSPLTDFELTERSGRPFRSADLRGKVWVATYFFTSCPGSCVALNRNVQSLHDLPELTDVSWVSITCDPETDTLDVLRAYAKRHRADPARWLFCRGELDYTQRVASGMKLRLSLRGHQEDAVVIDRAGQVRGRFDITKEGSRRRLQAKLLECLAEPLPESPMKSPSESRAIAAANGAPS